MKTLLALILALDSCSGLAFGQSDGGPASAVDLALVKKLGAAPTTDIVGLSFQGQKKFTGRELLELEKLHNLLSLDLSGTGVTDAALANLKSVPGLRALDLSQTAVTDEGLAHVAVLKHLRTLRLGKTRVRGLGLIELCDLAQLGELDFTGTPLDAEGVKLLQLFPKLTALSLEGTPLEPRLLSERWLADLTRLERINLCGTGASVNFASSGFGGSLDRYRLLWIGHTQEDRQFLTSVAFMPELSDLAIDHTRITAADMMKFKEMKEDGKLQKLKVLHVSADQLNDEIRAMFGTSFPELDLIVEKDAR